jgi:hypothetical protein
MRPPGVIEAAGAFAFGELIFGVDFGQEPLVEVVGGGFPARSGQIVTVIFRVKTVSANFAT